MLNSLLSNFSTQSKKGLGNEQAGIATGIIILIAGALGLGGIAALSAINWQFMMAVMVMVVIALGVIGTVFFKVPFKYVLVLAILCLGVVTFIQIGAMTAAGLIVVGGVLYKVNPNRNLALFSILIGVGLLTVILGSQLAIETLNISPGVPLGTVVP